ncbi:heparinase II/III-family protein [Roseomonas sp. USHLN139]|uniref:heparinase II/III-family protein n=1 Tax=Roseomonas sp. USHLN139 TaxID=3081298 RepID=UPI003B02856A
MAIQARNLQPGRAWLWLRTGARLGPLPLARYGWHRLRLAAGLPQRALSSPAALPDTPLFPDGFSGAPPALDAAAKARLRAALAALPGPVRHGGFDAAAPALGLDLFGPGDIRPVWEANRLAWLPLRVQAARLWPAEGHQAALESSWQAWWAANPPYFGPNWACGQEAALRILHLGLALVLAGRPPSPAARAFLRIHAARIAATASYARAQDNNHAISEPAGLLAAAWLLQDAAGAARAEQALSAAMARLVAADGGFAPVSTGYHRLLLDTLGALEAIRRHLGRPALAAPIPARAAAAAVWLARVMAPGGALPRLGHQDSSALADLGAHGAGDARGSVERALRLFAGFSLTEAEPGCAWLGLGPAPPLPRAASWTATGSRGWAVAGARALLRTGPLRFRPGQADLLHCEFWDGDTPLLTDAGTGAYNPPPGARWWLDYFPAQAAHNTIQFDGQEPMPRLGRFLFGAWPRVSALPQGAMVTDRFGRRHRRQICAEGRHWLVTDLVEGEFARAVLRWRLGPGDWALQADGVAGPARLRITADAPLTLRLERGWESPAYGQVRPCRVLAAEAEAPLRCLLTRILLPPLAAAPEAPCRSTSC